MSKKQEMKLRTGDMQAIKTFEVYMDVSGCDRLYDYVTGHEFRRPEGQGWDLTMMQHSGSLDHVDDADENTLLMVDLLDRAINDRKLIDRQDSSEDSDGDDEEDAHDDVLVMDNNADLPTRVLPVYTFGDVVKGKVILELNNTVEAQKVSIHLLGQSQVSIRVYNAKGYWDQKDSEKFIDEERNLWESSDYEEDVCFSGSPGQDAAGDLVQRSRALNSGRHEYPFEFTLPTDGGQSVPPLIPSTINYGYIVYRLKAKIHKGGILSRGGIAVYKGLWLERPFDISEDPENLKPIVMEETLDTGIIPFWKQGKIKVTASIPCRGHIKGHDVPLTVEIQNETKGEITSLEARVVMSGKVRASSSKGTMTYGVNVKSDKVKKSRIGSERSPTFRWKIPWNFSQDSMDGNLMPVGTLADSKLLEVKYNIVVKMKRKGTHRNVEMEIPIVVGNCNKAAGKLKPTLSVVEFID